MGTQEKVTHGLTEDIHGFGVFSWDIVENIVRGDHRFAQFYGLAPDVLDAGLPVEKLFERIAPVDVARIAERTYHAIVTGEPFHETFFINRPSGGTIRVSVYSNCFHRIDGMLTHCAGSMFKVADNNEQSKPGQITVSNVMEIAPRSIKMKRRSDAIATIAKQVR